MLRTCYLWLIRLHPAPFRQQFAEEMLTIFDDVAACKSVRGLFVDAAASLFRQWVLRPEFRRASPDKAVPVASGQVPLFASLDSYKLRPVPLLSGCLLSIVVLWAVATASVRPGKLPSWLIGAHTATGDLLPIQRSSLTETEPNTLVRFGPEAEDPWRAVAAVYFKLIPVLGALDANSDFLISPWEIVTAPSALRRLDGNHDGKLSPEECGFSLGLRSGVRSQDAPDPEFVRQARTEFMRHHPVLAALDADHDSEISAEEIRNSSRSLGKLDSNGDGRLTPNEVIPDRAATQAAAILQRLDTDRNGRISIAERESEEAKPLREILVSADRNRDGVTTLAELTRELRIREEARRETDRALKAASAGR